MKKPIFRETEDSIAITIDPERINPIVERLAKSMDRDALLIDCVIALITCLIGAGHQLGLSKEGVMHFVSEIYDRKQLADVYEEELNGMDKR